MKTTAAVALVVLLCLSAPVSTVPYLSLDYPVNTPNTTATVGRTFGIWGTALNSDFVHVWGFPVGQSPVFMGAVLTNGAHLQKQIDTGSFSLVVRDAPLGTYPVVVYAHDPVTLNFPTELGIMVTVQTCTGTGFVSWPFKGPFGPVSIPMAYCGT